MEKTSVFGFLGNMQSIHMALQEIRQKEGREVSLASHLKSTSQGKIGIEHLYDDLGIDPRVTTVQNLMATMEGEARYLFPEIIRDAIQAGVVAAPVWPELIVLDEPVSQPSQVVPKMNLADAKPEEIAEGATIPKGTLTHGSKTVQAKTFAKGIDITYEAIQYCSLNLVSRFFVDLGTRLGALLSREAVTVAINGEQDDSSESAAVIGIADTGAGLTYRDIAVGWLRMQLMGNIPTAIVSTEELALDIILMDQFIKRYTGAPDVTLRQKTPLPVDQDIMTQAAVPSGKLLEISKAAAMYKLTAQALMVETDKVIARRLHEAVASITTGFGILNRAGRLVIDTSLVRTVGGANDFPSWFNPQE